MPLDGNQGRGSSRSQVPEPAVLHCTIDVIVGTTPGHYKNKQLRLMITFNVQPDRFIPRSVSLAPFLDYAPRCLVTKPSPYQRLLYSRLCKDSASVLSFSKQKESKQPSNQPKPTRKISKTPYKILEAPKLRNDFYCNLLDWSSRNMIGVGLSTQLYIWQEKYQATQLLFDNGLFIQLTSVSFNNSGNILYCGDDSGFLHQVNVERKLEHSIDGLHLGRIGALACFQDSVAAGSKDGSISMIDSRTLKNTGFLTNHTQEVCGLKWNHDGNYLASGGNDMKVYIWCLRTRKPLVKFGHKAAVKALAWSPHKRNMLISGGGLTDKTVRMWSIDSLSLVQKMNTNSQICSMVISPHSNQLITTSGYSLNSIDLWDLTNKQRIATLLGHSSRPLYTALGPEGDSIVTGAGDQTLRFWKVFAKAPRRQEGVQEWQAR